MSTEIYYLSGTGNALFLARELKARLPDAELLPISALLRRGSYKTRGDAVGFVFPVHALTIPLAVGRFLRRLDLSSADYLFAVATRKDTRFYGFRLMDRLLGRSARAPAGLSMEKPVERPPTTPEQEEAILRDHFTVGKWSGLDNHVCACGAGFLDPAAAVDHWLAQHSGWTPPPETDIVDTGLVTPTEDPIFKEVEVSPGQEKENDE